MNTLKFLLIVPMVGFAVLACMAARPALEAAHLLAHQDDPVALSDSALGAILTREVAQREIEAALAAGDTELAQSFVELAQERGITIEPGLAAKVESQS